MYTEITHDLINAAIYLVFGIIAASDDKDSIMRSLGVIVLALATAFLCLLLHERYAVLHRTPVISSCILIQDSEGSSHYVLVDSTLRCVGGYDTPFYTVAKAGKEISPNDTCLHCRAVLKNHFDVSDHTTPAEREARIQQQIDYLTAPL